MKNCLQLNLCVPLRQPLRSFAFKNISARCDVKLCVVRSLTYINSLVITTSLALTLNI
ncbi:MAG: hypothetical protein HWQ41_19205 [Nostoc sp. NOS(2021)]|uniref:hypothetical protein n=1 Tax=Nostoc sp. NOS(2021) TaxID=2815407 RepID=UPI0025CE2E60|nr:hypothetical protein [Nostoc sp. NOS(2021)]MBN3897324.1 hypothetical protein [Nostoc sp. NOS(2021)]